MKYIIIGVSIVLAVIAGTLILWTLYSRYRRRRNYELHQVYMQGMTRTTRALADSTTSSDSVLVFERSDVRRRSSSRDKIPS